MNFLISTERKLNIAHFDHCLNLWLDCGGLFWLESINDKYDTFVNSVIYCINIWWLYISNLLVSISFWLLHILIFNLIYKQEK